MIWRALRWQPTWSIAAERSNGRSIDAELDLVEAAEAFLASTFRRFPEMLEGQLVELISRSELLKVLAGNWQ